MKIKYFWKNEIFFDVQKSENNFFCSFPFFSSFLSLSSLSSLSALLFLFVFMVNLRGDCFSVFFLFCFLFFLVFVVGKEDVSLSKGKSVEKISVCYGVLYGNVLVDPIKFFVHYYRKLGVERVITYLHPSLIDRFSEFQGIGGLSATMWHDNYDTNYSKTHRRNHRLALEQCIRDEIKEGVTVVIVCDVDEFLYFHVRLYPNFQALLRQYREEGFSQISISSEYYELGLCLRNQTLRDKVTIWESPYRTGEITHSTKSLFFTDQFLGTLDSHTAHNFNVSGRRTHLSTKEVRFLHYRRFPIWKGECEVVSDDHVQFAPSADTTDPAQKSRYRHEKSLPYRRDYDLLYWRDFVEDGKTISFSGHHFQKPKLKLKTVNGEDKSKLVQLFEKKNLGK